MHLIPNIGVIQYKHNLGKRGLPVKDFQSCYLSMELSFNGKTLKSQGSTCHHLSIVLVLLFHLPVVLRVDSDLLERKVEDFTAFGGK